ncbi:hypothetical protein OEZ85_007604 [Tetradesmus obliquus]|uniref:Uncharacterized protein n=1 Tax=Tetradesmus obliquus TaxID=3088 RepID=A0ABY8TGX3_TETOB|nr:hypothetical protein OEZ85_007604 [Tetradesmus obliquus]
MSSSQAKIGPCRPLIKRKCAYKEALDKELHKLDQARAQLQEALDERQIIQERANVLCDLISSQACVQEQLQKHWSWLYGMDPGQLQQELQEPASAADEAQLPHQNQYSLHGCLRLVDAATPQLLQQVLSMTTEDWVRLCRFHFRAAAAAALSTEGDVNLPWEQDPMRLLVEALCRQGTQTQAALLHHSIALLAAGSMNWETMQFERPSAHFWRCVVDRLHLSPAQVLHFKMALREFRRLNRASTAAGLDLRHWSSSFTNLYLVNTFCCNVLTPYQHAVMWIASYPYMPEPAAMAEALEALPPGDVTPLPAHVQARIDANIEQHTALRGAVIATQRKELCWWEA